MELILGDCLEAVEKLASEGRKVDAIIVDPPYGTTSCAWDAVIPFEELWKIIGRISKRNSPVCIFGQEPFSSFLRLSNLKSYRYDIYWQKERITNIFQVKRRVGKDVENISVFYEKQPTFNPQMLKHEGKLVSNGDPSGKKMGILLGGESENRCGVKGYHDTGLRYPTQILKIPRDSKNCQLHPTQKPLKIMEFLVELCTGEGQVVLDPFMGSGTTGMACKNLKRHFIGIEKDEKYFEIAKERIGKCD